MVRLILIVIMLLIGGIPLCYAQTMSRDEWKQHMQTVVPKELCKDGGYVRKCNPVSRAACLTEYVADIQHCLQEMADLIPDNVDVPPGGSGLGRRVSWCAHTKATANFRKRGKHIASEECGDAPVGEGTAH